MSLLAQKQVFLTVKKRSYPVIRVFAILAPVAAEVLHSVVDDYDALLPVVVALLPDDLAGNLPQASVLSPLAFFVWILGRSTNCRSPVAEKKKRG